MIPNSKKQEQLKYQMDRVVILSIVSIALYFIVETVRPLLPFDLLTSSKVNISPTGLLIILIVIANSIIFPTLLYKVKPKLTTNHIVLFCGFLILSIEITFKVLQNLLITNQYIFSDSINILKMSFVVAIIGMSISNIRIRKLRKLSLTVPVFILIIVWLAIGQLTI